MVEANKTYVGFVEDNNDPKKIGRVKIRVMDVFDEMDIDDIPWAMPWKDLNGNSFNVPENGKVVMVIFDQGNVDSPEFIYADHYNINLENKLSKLSDSDYTSMKSLIFDHKTQLYVNDKEGLKIDHKYNNINLAESGIDLNLKDNSKNINIGDSTANQQAILGNHWMEWFDEFVDNLLGSKAGPYLGNLGAPVIPAPAMASVLLKYKTLRSTNFLSNHVNIVDNNKVKTVLNSEREDTAQYGDGWASTVDENNITEVKDENFKPVEPDEPDEEIEMIISYLEEKGYKVNKEKGILNIVALRNKDKGIITNKFDDTLFVVWKNDDDKWKLLEAQITTVPGFELDSNELKQDELLLSNGQYVNELELVNDYLIFKESYAHVNNSVNKYDWKSEKMKTRDVKILPANIKGSEENVFDKASNASQVFKSINNYNQFITLCKEQVSKYKLTTFTYTLISKSDFDIFLEK